MSRGGAADELGHVEREIRKRFGGNALASGEDPHVPVAVTQRLAMNLEPRGRQIDEPDLANPDPRVERDLDATVEPQAAASIDLTTRCEPAYASDAIPESR